MTDRTHAAIVLSTAIGLVCLAGAPLIAALCTALVERVVGLAYSLSDQGSVVVRVAGAVVAGIAIAAVINAIVLGLYGGELRAARLYLATFAIAVAAYAAIFLLRLVQTGDLAAVFAVHEWRDGYLRLASGLYLVYAPAAAAGYAATFWLLHLGFRHMASG